MTMHFYHRDDSRFAHPDMREYFTTLRATDLRNADLQYNPDMPAEERIANARASYEQMKALLDKGGKSDRTSTVMVPPFAGEDAAPEVRITVSRPSGFREGRSYPCIFLIPAGGLQSCMDFVYDPETMADELRSIVVVTTYRTINDPNGLFPAAINDLHAIWSYLDTNADGLHIDANRMVIYGESTGGHLALSLSHRLKAAGYTPRGVLALVPVTDERSIYPSSNYVSNIWNGRDVFAYGSFWLHNMQSCLVPAEAFANHATAEECVGLPPTIIYTGEADPCVDPCLVYASKLIEAGVYTSMHLWGGGGHDISSARGEGYPDRIQGQVREDLLDLIKNDFRRPWLTPDE